MKKDTLVSLAWGGGIVLLSLAASFLLTHGYIDEDTTLRVVAMNGLMVANYGNRAPKAVAPSAYVRKVKRVTGWSLVVGGLIYAGFWAFAPDPAGHDLWNRRPRFRRDRDTGLQPVAAGGTSTG